MHPGILLGKSRSALLLIIRVLFSLPAWMVLLPTAFWLARRRPQTGVGLLYSSSPGSLGDDALVTSAVETLCQSSGGPVSLVEIQADWDWPLLDQTKFSSRSNISKILLFGLFLGYTQLPRLIWRLRAVRHLFVIGADVLDGAYGVRFSLTRLRLVGFLARLGFQVQVLGFSFNATAHPRIKKTLSRLSRLVQLHVRDPISLSRVLAVPGMKHADLVADIAFLLEPHPPRVTAKFQAWHRTQSGRKLLGLNLSSHIVNQMPQEERDTVLQRVAAEICLLIDNGVSILYLPHDFRAIEGRSDYSIGVIVASLLPVNQRERFLLVEDLRNAGEAKYYASRVDLMLTGRMHLAIAALGSGVPIVGLVYQDKFEGLLRHFDLLSRRLHTLSDWLEEGALRTAIEEAFLELEADRQAIAAALPKVRALALANFRTP